VTSPRRNLAGAELPTPAMVQGPDFKGSKLSKVFSAKFLVPFFF